MQSSVFLANGFAAISGKNTVEPGGSLALKPGKVKLSGGRYVADHGTLRVPENREDPNARLIRLPVTRIRAIGPSPAEPIFHLGGGPGLSNLNFRPPLALLEHHDVVLVGYRGVDGSPVLDCPEVSRAMKGVDGDLFSPASRAALAQAIQNGARRLQEQGIDLSGYNIPEVIADLEAARQALGYGRIHLLSQSYGTRVALLYAQQHPERIHRSVMIGVNPPGRFVWEPGKIDAQLAQYGRLWAASPASGGRDLVEMMRRVNQAMPRRWLFLPIDPGKVKAASFALLFHRGTAAMVFDAYRSAARGDPSGLALLSLVYDFALPGMFNWGDFMAKGFSADYDAGRDYTDLAAPETIMGSPLAQLFWPSARFWPAPVLPDEFRRAKPSEVETLLISGSLDFSTPAEYAKEELLPYLSRGSQVILAEMGHTGDLWGGQPQATEHLIAHFFDTGEVDASRFTYAPMDFEPKIHLATLAKALVLVPITLAGLTGALAWRRVSTRH